MAAGPGRTRVRRLGGADVARFWTVLQFAELELMPALMQQPRLNSFPFLDFAVDCLVIGFLWLGAAIAGWVWVATGRRRSV